MLPASSVAVQVTVVSPSLNASGASFSIVTWLTTSVAIGNDNETVLLSDEVASAINSSGCTRDGAVVSIMVTFWVAVEIFPEESVAVQVTMVSPSGNDSGESLVTVDTSTRSDDSALLNDTTLVSNEVASCVMSDGAVMVGIVVSCMITFWVAVDVLPDLSVAVQVTVVSPRENWDGASLSSFAIS